MSHLIFIRHAETDMAGTFCGHSDPAINAIGRMQVADLIARLAGRTFDTIYSSDLQRATNTAIPIAESLNLPYSTTSNLREIYFGDWEGLTWNEVEERDPTYAQQWLQSFPSLPAPHGETFAAFESRILQEVAHLQDMGQNTKVIVVTHGGAMRIVLRALLGCTEEAAYETTKTYCSSFECTDTSVEHRAVR
jgi:alpha-ribazole phosphatase/probable phosphoglycerate mutase